MLFLTSFYWNLFRDEEDTPRTLEPHIDLYISYCGDREILKYLTSFVAQLKTKGINCFYEEKPKRRRHNVLVEAIDRSKYAIVFMTKEYHLRVLSPNNWLHLEFDHILTKYGQKKVCLVVLDADLKDQANWNSEVQKWRANFEIFDFSDGKYKESSAQSEFVDAVVARIFGAREKAVE